MTRRQTGFTIVELMVALSIVSLLSAIALPVLSRYLRKSRSVEAPMMLKVIYEGVAVYVATERGSRGAAGGSNPVPLPITSTVVPAALPSEGRKYTPLLNDWEDPTWRALGVHVGSPIQYQYQYCLRNAAYGATGSCLLAPPSSGTAGDFDTVAQGDTNGNGVYAVFSRAGMVVDGEVRGAPGLYMYNRDE